VKGVAQSMHALATVLDTHLNKPTDIESLLPSALRGTADSLKETIARLQSQVEEAAKDAAAENLLHNGEDANELNHDDRKEGNHEEENINGETTRVAADDAEEDNNSSPFMRPEDEPQSHEVFMKKIAKNKNTAKYLFNPNWTGKMAWDFFVMFLVRQTL